jgi:hypothetical protein
MNETLKHDAEKFAQFLTAQYPPAREWCDPVGYCAWNISKGYIAAAVAESGEIVGICAMRPVERPGLGVLPFYSNENGTCLHVDLLVDISGDLRAITAFRKLFGIRFGPRKTVTMFRHTETALKVYPYHKFWANISRIKKVKMKKESKQYGSTTTTSPAGT